MRLFTSSKQLVGIDIGSNSIKLVELKGSPTRWSLAKYAISEIPSGSTEKLSPEERRMVVTSALKSVVSTARISTKKVATSVSGNAVIVRYVKFPRMNPSDLEKTIQFEAEPYIPFDIREVNISTHILGDVMEDGQPKMETVLVGAKKELLQERLEIIEGAGLKLLIIDVDAFALENAYEISRNKQGAETVMLLNLGATTSNINILENGASKIVRDIFIAGNSLTEAIQKNLQVDYSEAENLKKEHGLTLTREEEELESIAAKDETKIQVSTILMAVIRELVGEVRRSIDYYQAQTGGEKGLDRIILSGGTSRLKNLDRFFSDELGLRIDMNNPFEGIDTARVPDRDLQEMAPLFPVAVGLATRRKGDSK
jgi:type IV pilus assembly protein PilM